MALQSRFANCGMCNRQLDVAGDRLSEDCGGDCWGCIGLIEAEMGDNASLKCVVWEVVFGIRTEDLPVGVMGAIYAHVDSGEDIDKV